MTQKIQNDSCDPNHCGTCVPYHYHQQQRTYHFLYLAYAYNYLVPHEINRNSQMMRNDFCDPYDCVNDSKTVHCSFASYSDGVEIVCRHCYLHHCMSTIQRKHAVLPFKAFCLKSIFNDFSHFMNQNLRKNRQ